MTNLRRRTCAVPDWRFSLKETHSRPPTILAMDPRLHIQEYAFRRPTGGSPERNSANYDNHYAFGEGDRTSHYGTNLSRLIVYLPVLLLGEGTGARLVCSASDVFSSEEPSVYGPGTWSNHRQRAAEDRQHE